MRCIRFRVSGLGVWGLTAVEGGLAFNPFENVCVCICIYTGSLINLH